MAQDSVYEDYITKLKAIFNTIQLAGDRKCFLVLWAKADFDICKNIRHSTQIPLEFLALSIHIPRLFIKKGREARIEYLQYHIGHYEIFVSMKKDIRGWLSTIYSRQKRHKRYAFSRTHIQ